jgi:hypothetical protein
LIILWILRTEAASAPARIRCGAAQAQLPFFVAELPEINSKLVDFGSEHEIALSQAVNLMRPDGNVCLAPAKADVGMMSLRFG